MAKDNVEIIPSGSGFIAKINSGVALPGIYTSEFMAQKAVEKYLNKGKEIRASKGK